ncbi:MAG: nucleotidyltransferase domain-containing protein [Verrucomicrobiota bacterium]|nr:nucleotidyltransferase domain-containing protein [Verrucomicrobiota bacterium]
MLPILTAQRAAIEDLCRRLCVERLEVFGSATRADFDEKTSDIDLIVQFRDEELEGLFDRYWTLTEELERLLGRPVELLTERMIRNPYFRAVVDAERQTIYAGEPEQALR